MRSVNYIVLPSWLQTTGIAGYNTGTSYEVAEASLNRLDIQSSGYQFNVDVNHLHVGFSTPSNWVLSVPGVSTPVFDLANKFTGFSADSEFTLTSSASGVVTCTDYQLVFTVDVLGYAVFQKSFSASVGSSPSGDDDAPQGDDSPKGETIDGSLGWNVSLNPAFTDSLLPDPSGFSINASVNPELSITMPVFAADIPLFSVPGLADLTAVATATVSLGASENAPGGQMFSITANATSAGLQIQTIYIDPSIGIAITGTGGGEAVWGLGSASVSITGALTQNLDCKYDAKSGWAINAPGSLNIQAKADYSTLWGIGPSGSEDLFNWDLASWDPFGSPPAAPSYSPGDNSGLGVEITNIQANESTSVFQGDSVPIALQYQQVWNGATITVGWAQQSWAEGANPENGILRADQVSTGVPQSLLGNTTLSLSTDGLAYGAYCIFAEISDFPYGTQYFFAPSPVNIVSRNQPPVLSNATVSPSAGTNSTQFAYQVQYYDADGYPPSDHNVYIGGGSMSTCICRAMTLQAGSVSTAGGAYSATYSYSPVTLSNGNYEYFFSFGDGINPDVQTAIFGGPYVANSTNTLVKFWAAVNNGARVTDDINVSYLIGGSWVSNPGSTLNYPGVSVSIASPYTFQVRAQSSANYTLNWAVRTDGQAVPGISQNSPTISISDHDAQEIERRVVLELYAPILHFVRNGDHQSRKPAGRGDCRSPRIGRQPRSHWG